MTTRICLLYSTSRSSNDNLSQLLNLRPTGLKQAIALPFQESLSSSTYRTLNPFMNNVSFSTVIVMASLVAQCTLLFPAPLQHRLLRFAPMASPIMMAFHQIRRYRMRDGVLQFQKSRICDERVPILYGVTTKPDRLMMAAMVLGDYF